MRQSKRRMTLALAALAALVFAAFATIARVLTNEQAHAGSLPKDPGRNDPSGSGGNSRPAGRLQNTSDLSGR
jgi:hypothetical protein